MAFDYFDSSGLVERYVQESGTAWVQGLTHPGAGNWIYVARITGVEVCAAISRRRRAGSVAAADAAASMARFRLDIDQEYLIVEITTTMLTDAMRFADIHELRAHDAVQLAAAVELDGRWLAAGTSGITPISADQDLNTADSAEGLLVDDPNSHP